MMKNTENIGGQGWAQRGIKKAAMDGCDGDTKERAAKDGCDEDKDPLGPPHPLYPPNSGGRIP